MVILILYYPPIEFANDDSYLRKMLLTIAVTIESIVVANETRKINVDISYVTYGPGYKDI